MTSADAVLHRSVIGALWYALTDQLLSTANLVAYMNRPKRTDTGSGSAPQSCPAPAGSSPGSILLAVDIGNTNIVLGAYRGDVLHSFWRISTDRRRTADEYAMLLRDLLSSRGLQPSDVSAMVLASGVPPVLAAFEEVARDHWSIEPIPASQGLDLGIPIDYNPPQSVGIDRLVNAVAVLTLYRCPAVIVDFGTATTLDALNGDGVYIGGAIAPGIIIGSEALFERTSLLPRIQLAAPPQAIGRSTVESMQSGILYGYAALVDGLVERFQAELGGGAFVVGTGGLAGVVAPHTRTVEVVNEELTLHGLRLVYERHRGTIGA